MSLAVIIVQDPSSPERYQSLISHTVRQLLQSNSRASQQKQLQGAIKNMAPEQQLNKYKELKAKATKKLHFFILGQISTVNRLTNYLLSFYNLSRKVILQHEKEGGFVLKPPFSTQVLYNIRMEDINKRDASGKLEYDWDIIVTGSGENEDDEEYRELLDAIKKGREGMNATKGKSRTQFKQYDLDDPETNGGNSSTEQHREKVYYEDHWNKQQAEFNVGCIGGTFDHLHDGHKILLSIGSFLSRKKLIVGLSDQDLLKNKKHREFLQSYAERLCFMSRFVRYLKPTGFEFEVYELNDVYGPTAFVREMDLLLVTEETAKGGNMVNEKRRENGLRQLEIFTVKLIEDDNKDDKISSTYIREIQHSEFNRLLK